LKLWQIPVAVNLEVCWAVTSNTGLHKDNTFCTNYRIDMILMNLTANAVYILSQKSVPMLFLIAVWNIGRLW